MKIQFRKYYHIVIAVSFLCLLACRNNPLLPDSNSLTPTTTAFGNVNQLVIVMEPDAWEGHLGDSIRFLFESAYPILPQPEALFDLRHLSYTELIGNKTKRELRNYLFVSDWSKADSSAKKLLNEIVGRDRLSDHLNSSQVSNLLSNDIWAKGQQFLYLIGNNEADLINRLKKSFGGLANQVRAFDNKTIHATVYAAGDAIEINNSISTKYNIKLNIPSDWKMALDNDHGTWIRKETDKSSFNLILNKIKYHSTNQFTEKGIKSIRDSLVKPFVRTESKGDVMVINDQDLPIFLYQKTMDGNYGVELRGVWETKLEYMGGPFQTYVFQTPKKDSLMVIDVFIYAPEQEKRDLIQQLEAIVKTFKFISQ